MDPTGRRRQKELRHPVISLGASLGPFPTLRPAVAATHRGTTGRALKRRQESDLAGSSSGHQWQLDLLGEAAEELDAVVEAAHGRPPDTGDSGDESSLMLSAWISSWSSPVDEHLAHLAWELGQYVVELPFSHVAAERLRRGRGGSLRVVGTRQPRSLRQARQELAPRPTRPHR
jgi:hypothetical protein